MFEVKNIEETDNHLKKINSFDINGQIRDSMESLTSPGIKDVHIRIEKLETLFNKKFYKLVNNFKVTFYKEKNKIKNKIEELMYKDLFEVLEILNIEEIQLIQYGLDKLIHSDSREILQDTGRITEILLLNNLLEFMDKEFESLERKLSINLEKKMERLYISLEERNEQSLKVIEFDMKEKNSE